MGNLSTSGGLYQGQHPSYDLILYIALQEITTGGKWERIHSTSDFL